MEKLNPYQEDNKQNKEAVPKNLTPAIQQTNLKILQKIKFSKEDQQHQTELLKFIQENIAQGKKILTNDLVKLMGQNLFIRKELAHIVLAQNPNIAQLAITAFYNEDMEDVWDAYFKIANNLALRNAFLYPTQKTKVWNILKQNNINDDYIFIMNQGQEFQTEAWSAFENNNPTNEELIQLIQFNEIFRTKAWNILKNKKTKKAERDHIKNRVPSFKNIIEKWEKANA